MENMRPSPSNLGQADKVVVDISLGRGELLHLQSSEFKVFARRITAWRGAVILESRRGEVCQTSDLSRVMPS